MSTGYRNPPKNTQFKKGSSGNPMGRPRRDQQQVAVGYLFRKVAWELVPIEVDGRRVRIPRWDLYMRQIHTMALNKNISAARLIDQLRTQFPGEALPGDPIYFLITEADAEL
jgi:hypothetical protein